MLQIIADDTYGLTIAKDVRGYKVKFYDNVINKELLKNVKIIAEDDGSGVLIENGSLLTLLDNLNNLDFEEYKTTNKMPIGRFKRTLSFAKRDEGFARKEKKMKAMDKVKGNGKAK